MLKRQDYNITKGTVIAILIYNREFWNSLINKFFALPTIIAEGASCLYILVSETHGKLEEFVLNAKAKTDDFHVFSVWQERTMTAEWTRLGLVVTYQSQKMDYMGYVFAIKYLKIRNPETGMSISLIPWFMIPGRPFPVFVYIFAIWHYSVTGKKSLKDSADATKKLFKIDTFNKSTVSRNIKALENFVDISLIDSPLSANAPEAPSTKPEHQACEEMIKHVTKILEGCPSVKSLEKVYGDMFKRLPPPVRPAASDVLSSIPDKISKILKPKNPAELKVRDARVRPPRPKRGNRRRRVQQRRKFVDSAEIESTRIAFIEFCKCLVLDAAEKYHLFLF
jgi:hypothetical protein